jgi:hypothetical protein
MQDILMAVVPREQRRDEVPAVAANPPVSMVRRLHREHVESDSHETTSLSFGPAAPG